MQIAIVSEVSPKPFQDELNSKLKLLERTDKIDRVEYDVKAMAHPGHPGQLLVIYTAFISHYELEAKAPELSRVEA